MNKYILISITCLLLMKCNSSNNQIEQLESQVRLRPIVLNAGDTIENGSIFSTKVYLNDDYLYKKAQKNGIEDYLKITFEDSINYKKRYSFPSKKATIIGDTGIVKFKVLIDSLASDEIIKMNWLTVVSVKFNLTKSVYDTAFMDTIELYVTNPKLLQY